MLVISDAKKSRSFASLRMTCFAQDDNIRLLLVILSEAKNLHLVAALLRCNTPVTIHITCLERDVTY